MPSSAADFAGLHLEQHVGALVLDRLERSDGRPNCTRTFAYSTAISSTFCAPPTCSAAGGRRRRDRAPVESTFQPSPSVPLRLAGVFTNSSLACFRVWSIIERGAAPAASLDTANGSSPCRSSPRRGSGSRCAVERENISRARERPAVAGRLRLHRGSGLVHLPGGLSEPRGWRRTSPEAMPGRYFALAASSPEWISVLAASATVEK